MTRTKRMTAAVLTLVLLLNFAGCGAKNALFDRVSGAGKFAGGKPDDLRRKRKLCGGAENRCGTQSKRKKFLAR